MHLYSRQYLYYIRTYVYWSRWYVERKPRTYDQFATDHNANCWLDKVEKYCEPKTVFGKTLDDRYVPSLCQISGVRISGRQVFPRKRVCQSEQQFDISFTVTVRIMNIVFRQ